MGKGVNVPTINQRFMDMPAEGYLSPDDQAFLDRMLGRSSEYIDSGVQQQQGTARARLAQRRIGGPAAEQVLSDIGSQGSLARARAAGSVADIGHSIFEGNKGWARHKIDTAWGAELGAHARYDQRHAAQQAAWGNAIASAAGLAGSYFTGGVTSAGGGGAKMTEGFDVPDYTASSGLA